MPQARVGQRVQVDISGLQAPGISVGGGMAVTGVITALDAAAGQITVRLDMQFSGQDTVVVSPDRVTALED